MLVILMAEVLPYQEFLLFVSGMIYRAQSAIELMMVSIGLSLAGYI